MVAIAVSDDVFIVFNVMFVRELAKHLSSTDVIVSAPCPAMCASEFRRDFMRGSAFLEWLERFFQRTIMFTGEEGARNFVYCALGKDVENIHGQFIQLSKVEEVSKYVLSEEGSSIQKRLWVSAMQFGLLSVWTLLRLSFTGRND